MKYLVILIKKYSEKEMKFLNREQTLIFLKENPSTKIGELILEADGETVRNIKSQELAELIQAERALFTNS